MPLRDGFFSTATQTSCCNRIQRSNRVRLLVVSTHDFPDKFYREGPRFFGGNDFGGGGKSKIWRYIFGGNAIRVCFSFFGGNMNGVSKRGGNCGA